MAGISLSVGARQNDGMKAGPFRPSDLTRARPDEVQWVIYPRIRSNLNSQFGTLIWTAVLEPLSPILSQGLRTGGVGSANSDECRVICHQATS